MDVEYKLSVYVDGKLVFASSYPDTVELEDDLSKAELMVERELENEQSN